MWQRCPKQYEFRYMKKLKIPPKGIMVQGSAYHGALKENFLHKIKTQENLKVKDLLDAYDDSWLQRLKGQLGDKEDDNYDIIDIDWEDKDPGKLKDDGALLLQLYHKNIAPNIVPRFVEQRAEDDIQRGIKYVGYPDLETDSEIIDHKVKSMSLNQEMAEKDSQVLSYCFLRKKFNFAFHVAIKKRVPEIQIVKVHKTIKDINWWIDMVRQIIAQINTGIAPPNNTGWWCSEKFCGYWKLCKGK